MKPFTCFLLFTVCIFIRGECSSFKAESSLNSRIIGGKEAVPNSIKYQVGLKIYTDIPNNTYFCGGSLISRGYVLTAAHCVDQATLVEVILGAHNITKVETTQVRLKSSKFIINENWNKETLTGDIALVKLPVDVEYDENIRPVTLPTSEDMWRSFAGEKATVSGWGLESDFSQTTSSVLRYVNVTVITNGLCSWAFFDQIKNTHICTSGFIGKSSCSGDSGGPLTTINGKQIGIVSFGLRFCQLSAPSVYTRVTEFLFWISVKTGIVIF